MAKEVVTHDDVVQALRNALYAVLTSCDYEEDDGCYVADSICEHAIDHAEQIQKLVSAYVELTGADDDDY